MHSFNSNDWALILGGSSGFGLASAKKLSQHGMNIVVVHRDRRASMTKIEAEFDEIKKSGVRFCAMNLDALAPEGRAQVVNLLKDVLGPTGKVKLLLHSIALGNLRPIAPAVSKTSEVENAIEQLATKLGVESQNVSEAINALLLEGVSPLHSLIETNYGSNVLGDEDMEQTIYNMGTNLLTWTQELFAQKFFASDARVLGLTSEGNQVAWKGYAAVSAAKVVLESVSRAIAVEFAEHGIRSNILQPGVTPTPALKLIPGSQKMMAVARLRNPCKRATTPEDVANVVALMCTDEAKWINGAVIPVDGGERIASL